MCCVYRAVSPDELRVLIAHPDLARAYFPGRGSLAPAADDDVLDVDKAWDGIHYLLTGSRRCGPPPLGDAVQGGVMLGDDAHAPRYLTPEEVAEVADGLAGVAEDDLRGRFGDGTPLTADDVYPAIWDEGEEAFDYLVTHLRLLVAFYRRSADRGRAVLIWIT